MCFDFHRPYWPLILTFTFVSVAYSVLLLPETINISDFKPINISPYGSTCGLDFKDTLCDNRLEDNKFCSNISNIIYCDQTCPFGNVFLDINKIEQLSLEKMEPCGILKDFGVLLTNTSSSLNSYLFDDGKNQCNNENNKANWKPFYLRNIASENPLFNLNSDTLSSVDTFNSGLTISLWFQQNFKNNG